MHTTPSPVAHAHAPAHANNTSPRHAVRLALMAANGLVFQLAYSACNAAAQRAQVTRHLATAWDHDVPLVPWMVLPYVSSVPLLMLGFALAVDRQALRAYSQRLLLTTVLGCLIFALWPQALQGPRALPATEPWATGYRWLHALDGPFNQCPSLHVAFMVVLWPTARAAVRSTAARVMLAAWLMLVAASTLLTHQHHLVDVPAGVLLGWWACRAVPAQRQAPAVALHYSVASMLAVVVLLTLPHGWQRAIAAWLAACTAGVAWAYRSGNAQFLHKRDGRFPLWVWGLYGPYLVGYLITWRLVCWHERHHPPVQPWGPQLWVGRRLNAHEAARWLPPQCTVIDLANELTETHSLRAGQARQYHAVAVLDLLPVPAAARARVLHLLRQAQAEQQTVFLHCAMGYSRSRELAQDSVQADAQADVQGPNAPPLATTPPNTASKGAR